LKITDFNSDDCKYTTLKRSDLINFLKTNLEDLIKNNHSISQIEPENQKIKLTFENNENFECDYLVISDGIFSKSKNLISKNKNQPRYNNTLAIRGIISGHSKIDSKNISLFLGPDFHHVIYPVSQNGDLNFIAIMKYSLSTDDQKNYSLFDNKEFIKRILNKIPLEMREFLDGIKELKIFPVFVSDNFFKVENKNIHFIGDAFFSFPPSFAQGASQSIEGAHELYESILNKNDYFNIRSKRVKMINRRSSFNQFAFHLSSPMTTFFRDILMKYLVKNENFLENYLGKIYSN
jgi:salicylate hydroxylase